MQEQTVYYFDEHGEQNTDDVITVVEKRLAQDDLKTVVVASSSGQTAVTFGERLADKARVIAVSECPWVRNTLKHDEMAPQVRARLDELGVTVCDAPHVSGSFSWIGMDNVYGATDLTVLVYDVFRMVGGQGFKVAMEVGQMVANAGLVPPGDRVIACGGTMRGSDAAVVLKTAFSNDIFSKEPEKRVEMLELLCMPRTKSWFW